MRARTMLRTALVLGLMCGTMASECDPGGVANPPGLLLEVRMVNHPSSEQPIHIMDPQEGFNQSNRLAPGQERLTMVRLGTPNVDSASQVTFRAGRNGVVLSEITCIASGEATSFSRGLVTWVDERMTCEDRLAPI